MEKYRKPAGTGASDRWLKIQLAFFLPLVVFGLRLLGFRRVYVGLSRLGTNKVRRRLPTNVAQPMARHIAELAHIVNRGYFCSRFACLAESLTLWWILLSYGISAEFRLGVRTITGPFESHAWVEYRGEVINDIRNINRIYEAFDLGGLTPWLEAS